MKNSNIWFPIQMTICYLKIRCVNLRKCKPKRISYTVIDFTKASTFVAWLCFPGFLILGNYFPFLLSLVITFISLTVFSKINGFPFKIIMFYSYKKKLSSILKKKSIKENWTC